MTLATRPPHGVATPGEDEDSLDCERRALGIVLVQPEQWARLASLVGEGDFAHPAHAAIFRAMGECAAKGVAIDPVSVANELRASKRLNSAGGLSYLGALTDTFVTPRELDGAAASIKSASIARVALRCLAKARAKIMDGGDAEAAVAQAVAELQAVPKARESTAILRRVVEQVVEKSLDRVERIARGEDVEAPGLSWGIKCLDDLFVIGPQPGDCGLIAGRPSNGKSALAQQFATNTARDRGDVLFAPLEMTPEALAAREIARHSGLPPAQVQAGTLGAAELETLVKSTVPIDRARYEVHVMRGEQSARSIVAQAETLLAGGSPLVLVVVDYLQLLTFEGGEQFRERQIADAMRLFKRAAVRLNIVFLILSQFNRDAAKSERPQLHHLRESGALEQDADWAVFVHRPDLGADEGELILAKRRNGPVGFVKAGYSRARTTFFDPTQQQNEPDGENAYEP